MAAKRLRAAPTRLARALFWLGRSPISPDTGKANPRGSGDSGRPGMRKIAARFGVASTRGSGS
jgi:hypothetical protein